MQPVNVCELNPVEFKKFLDSFDHVFSDCDGVIWSGAPYPGVGQFFSVMEKLGKTVNYASNNSLRTKQNYDNKFKQAGIENGYDKLTIPSVAVAEYLKSVGLKKKVYCVTAAETVNVLRAEGFQCVTGPDEVPDNYSDFLQFLEDDEEIGAVLFDSDYKVNVPKLYRAETYLKRPDVLFLTGATDVKIPISPGVVAIGSGQFTNIVAESVKREPLQLGKPGKIYGELAMKRAGVTDPSRVLFIGDMIEQDVGLGKNTGFKTLLVLTNNTKDTMMAHPTIKPDFYAPELGSIVPLLNAAAKL